MITDPLFLNIKRGYIMANVFTDAQIAEILDLINKETGHLQYIGARYVPLFGRKGEDSIEWDNSAPYEPLTIVMHNGNSFTSRQYVPAGIDINSNEFWAETGNYNSQIEQYRNEVMQFDQRIKDNAQAIQTEITNRVNAVEAEKTARENAITAEADTRKREDDAINTSLTNINQTLSALGTAAKKNVDTNPTLNSKNLVESGGVKAALNTLDEEKVNKYNNMIWIGDSFSEVSTLEYNWPLRVSVQLGVKNFINNSKGGAGFNGKFTFIDQLKTAHNSMTDADAIVIMGGENDYFVQDGLSDKVYAFFQQLHAWYPDTEVIALCSNTISGDDNSFNYKYNNMIMNAFIINNIKGRLIDINSWLPTWNEYRDPGSSNYHPNNTSCQYYAAWATSAILGGTDKPTGYAYLTPKNTNSFSKSDLPLYCKVEGFKLTVPASTMTVGSAQISTGTLDVGTWSKERYATKRGNNYFPLRDNAGNQYGSIWVSRIGVTFIVTKAIPASTLLCIPTMEAWFKM